MINEFLRVLKDGYTVEFSENNTLNMVEIVVSKHGKTARHSINLDHLKEFGLTKEMTIMVVINQLIIELDNMGPAARESESV